MTRFITLIAALTATAPAFAQSYSIRQVEPEPPTQVEQNELDTEFFHGFRMGYSYVQSKRLPTPHNYVFGYELTQHIGGGEWLDVVLVENLMLTGLNQSLLIPSANLLVGFEIADQVQIGAGPNITPVGDESDMVHMVMGIGYTAKAGALNLPVHLSAIPDVDGENRIALTTGVNWKN